MHATRCRSAAAYLGCLAVLLFFDAASALALNGPELIGFSAASTALAGAGHVAVADTSAMNTNPAALSLIKDFRFDFTGGFLKPDIHLSNNVNSNAAGQNDPFALGNVGIAKRLSSIPGLTIGAGIFTQGGFGTDYRNVATPFGTVDQASSFLRYFKIAIGLSYDVTDKLTVGVAPNLGYSDVALRLFPGTSVPPVPGLPTGFAGFNIRDTCSRNGGLGTIGKDCPSDWEFGAKIGAMYRILPWLTLGATYTTPVKFNYTNGQSTLNFTAFGLGSVAYSNTQVAGFKWPQQVDVSMAAQPTERLLLAFTASWINWAALNSVNVTATNPGNPLAPGQVNLSLPLNWKDQAVIAVGVSFAALQDDRLKERDRLVLRAGYNYGNNPVPSNTLTPLAPVIIQHHATGGLGFRFTDSWSYDFAALYAFKNTQTSTSATSPFGPNTTSSVSGYYIYNTFSYRF
jgi:long-chain fatty acid transport protein